MSAVSHAVGGTAGASDAAAPRKINLLALGPTTAEHGKPTRAPAPARFLFFVGGGTRPRL